MAEKGQGVNLLPSLTKGEMKKERQKGQLILGTTGVTFLVALITAGLLFYNLYLQYKVQGAPFDFLNISGLDNQIEEINRDIDSKEDVLTMYTEVGTKVEFINNILLSRPDYQKILDRLQDLLPEDIEIEEYEIDESQTITLTGVSKDYYTLALFISRAQKEDPEKGNFDKFTLESADTRNNAVEFSISANAVFQDEELTAVEILGANTED